MASIEFIKRMIEQQRKYVLKDTKANNANPYFLDSINKQSNEINKANVTNEIKPTPSRTSIFLSRPKKYDTRYSTSLNQ